MEFAIFLNGFIPGPAAHDTNMQHLSYQHEAEYAIFAEHHEFGRHQVYVPRGI